MLKQLAIRLETTGFLKIERDTKNKRILRLKVTEKSEEYWKTRETEHAKSIAAYFKELEDDEVISLFKIMGKLEKKIRKSVPRCKKRLNKYKN